MTLANILHESFADCWVIAHLLCLFVDVANSLLERAVNLLPIIRRINDMHFNHIANMRLSGTSFPDLHDEVFRTKV